MSSLANFLYLILGLWFYFWLGVLTVVIGLSIAVSTFFDSRGYTGQQLIRFWGWSLLHLTGVRVQVEGLEHLDPNQTYVYAANHRSQFDIFVTAVVLPGLFRWVAKQSLRGVPVLGYAMARMNCIFVDRDNLPQAIRSLKQATNNVQQGYSMVIFPEGTRATSRELLPFKKGVFVMAAAAGQPLVPVSISGTLAIQPPRTLQIHPGPVKVVISPPIHPQDYKRKEDLMAAVRQAIEAHYDPDFPHGPGNPHR
jgi:1-acyl-sn-glycerol-3-phosphate acyltransferase